jgi:hypothetical protein
MGRVHTKVGFFGEIWRIASDNFCEHQTLVLTKCSQSSHKILREIDVSQDLRSSACSSIEQWLDLTDNEIKLIHHGTRWIGFCTAMTPKYHHTHHQPNYYHPLHTQSMSQPTATARDKMILPLIWCKSESTKCKRAESTGAYR